jgi:hypothetical protein
VLGAVFGPRAAAGGGAPAPAPAPPVPPPACALTYSTYLGGYVSTTVYDARGRLTAIVDPPGACMTYTYDCPGGQGNGGGGAG